MEEILDQRASRASGQQVVIVFARLLPHLLRQLEFLCGLLFQLGRLGLFQTPDLEFGKDTRLPLQDFSPGGNISISDLSGAHFGEGECDFAQSQNPIRNRHLL